MDYDKKESDRATSYDQVQQEGEYMHIIFFAAGTVLTMACFKHIMILLFVEQWRTRVFLLLNLVLLAIVFTSIRSASSTESKDSNDDVEEIVKVDNKEKEKPNVCSPKFEAGKDPLELCKSTSQANKIQQTEMEPQPPKLSKEELNERVEAFISTFRQQLVSDARERIRNQFLSKS